MKPARPKVLSWDGFQGAAVITTQKVSCPACGRQGEVTWEQAPAPGQPARAQLKDLSAGFVSVETSMKEAPRILCDACRIPARTM